MAPDVPPRLRIAAKQGDWLTAHQELALLASASPSHFAIDPASRDRQRACVLAEFPSAAADAANRADCLLAGEFDLLGYHGLRYDGPEGIDWHLDPVHTRRAPEDFWGNVRYLDSACGDHKIIWELNRHQHWLALGRAYWLTGDPRYRGLAIAELEQWMAANPPLTGINWASMLELGFRSISWLWAIHFFAEPAADDRSPWLVDLLVGLDRQLDHVEHNLSYYFSPNTHLLGEALALYVCGRALPYLAASERRAATGRRILLDEISRQIGSDGGHCERSTHYHRYTLDFYLLALVVARITRDDASQAFERAVERLGFAARLLADDLGRLPHLGDDDGGALFPLTGRRVDDIRDSLAAAAALTGRTDLRIGRVPEEPYWLLAHPAFELSRDRLRQPVAAEPIGSAALPDTGYYVSRSISGDHLIVDAGPHGYMNGGHAHADALSLTLSVHGRPLVVDPGTGCYTSDPALRDRFRSSALHNTLTLDERSQSLPSGPFHWAHTANSHAHRWRTNAGFDYFEGSHDGYLPLEHRRHVLALHGDLIVVADLIRGEDERTAPRRADVHWHIDPRWHVTVNDRHAELSAGGERVQIVAPLGIMTVFRADEQTGLGWHAPVYGRVEPAITIRVSHTGGVPLWTFSVIGLNPSDDILDADTVPVWTEAGVLQHSVGLRVTRRTSVDYFVLAAPAPEAAGGSHTWRVGEIETDAAMLFCRTRSDGRVVRIAMVDGSVVRASGHRRLHVALPKRASDVHLDLGGDDRAAHVSGPAVGARVQVGGRDCAIALERRGNARPKRLSQGT